MRGTRAKPCGHTVHATGVVHAVNMTVLEKIIFVSALSLRAAVAALPKLRKVCTMRNGRVGAPALC